MIQSRRTTDKRGQLRAIKENCPSLIREKRERERARVTERDSLTRDLETFTRASLLLEAFRETL